MDSTELSAILTEGARPGTSITSNAYEVDADIDRSGSITYADYDLANAAGTTPAIAAGLLTVPKDNHWSTSLTAGTDNIIGYCGYVFNPECAIYTVRFRHYDPALGRWLERDPAGYWDSMNSFEYVGGNATNFADPLGLGRDIDYEFRHWHPEPPSSPGCGGPDGDGGGNGNGSGAGGGMGGGLGYTEGGRPIPPPTLPPGAGIGLAADALMPGMDEYFHYYKLTGPPRHVGEGVSAWKLIWVVNREFFKELFRQVWVQKTDIALAMIPFGRIAKSATQIGRIGKLIKGAGRLYPGKVGRMEWHHVIPQYLKGAKNGARVQMPAEYHQLITNEFRRLHPYGTAPPTPQELERIMREVYKKYPIHPDWIWD